MDRTSAQLNSECVSRGVSLAPGKKYTRQDMVDLLAKDSLSRMVNPPWGLLRRLDIESPMLCFSFKHLHMVEKEVVVTSDNWIAEQKWDGARMIICYHPDEGFSFYSRNVSVTDFLPVPYTNTILLIKDGKVTKAGDWKGVFKVAFILDSEVVCENATIDTSLFSKYGVVTGSELNAVTAILSINDEDSHKIQKEQAPLTFKIFDVLYYAGVDVWKSPLRDRKVLLKKAIDKLSIGLPFHESPYASGVEKEEFYHKLIKAGKEGVVYKNLGVPYIPTTSRPRTTQIKRKRSVAESLGGDIDAFISGYVLPSEDRGWKDLIGAIEVSVFLKDASGSSTEHVIASISSMEMELRKKMTKLDPAGKPMLDPEFLGKVVVINGQDISSKARRFMHATCEWEKGFRTDKTKFDCVMEENFLVSQIL